MGVQFEIHENLEESEIFEKLVEAPRRCLLLNPELTFAMHRLIRCSEYSIAGDRPPRYGAAGRSLIAGDRPPRYGAASRVLITGDRPPRYGAASYSLIAGDRPPPLRYKKYERHYWVASTGTSR